MTETESWVTDSRFKKSIEISKRFQPSAAPSTSHTILNRLSAVPPVLTCSSDQNRSQPPTNPQNGLGLSTVVESIAQTCISVPETHQVCTTAEAGKTKTGAQFERDRSANILTHVPLSYSWYVGLLANARQFCAENAFDTFMADLKTLSSEVEKAMSNLTKTKRLTRLLVCLEYLIPLMYSNIQDELETGSVKNRNEYLSVMTKLMGHFLDVKIRASRLPNTRSEKKMAQEMLTSLYIFLLDSEAHICEAILLANEFTKRNAEMCFPIVRQVLEDPKIIASDEVAFVRYVLMYRLLRRLASNEDERRNVTKKAKERMNPGNQIVFALRTMNGLASHIPTSLGPELLIATLIAGINGDFLPFKKAFLENYSLITSSDGANKTSSREPPPRSLQSRLPISYSVPRFPAITAGPDPEIQEMEFVKKPPPIVTLDDDGDDIIIVDPPPMEKKNPPLKSLRPDPVPTPAIAVAPVPIQIPTALQCSDLVPVGIEPPNPITVSTVANNEDLVSKCSPSLVPITAGSTPIVSNPLPPSCPNVSERALQPFPVSPVTNYSVPVPSSTGSVSSPAPEPVPPESAATLPLPDSSRNLPDSTTGNILSDRPSISSPESTTCLEPVSSSRSFALSDEEQSPSRPSSLGLESDNQKTLPVQGTLSLVNEDVVNSLVVSHPINSISIDPLSQNRNHPAIKRRPEGVEPSFDNKRARSEDPIMDIGEVYQEFGIGTINVSRQTTQDLLIGSAEVGQDNANNDEDMMVTSPYGGSYLQEPSEMLRLRIESNSNANYEEDEMMSYTVGDHTQYHAGMLTLPNQGKIDRPSSICDNNQQAMLGDLGYSGNCPSTSAEAAGIERSSSQDELSATNLSRRNNTLPIKKRTTNTPTTTSTSFATIVTTDTFPSHETQRMMSIAALPRPCLPPPITETAVSNIQLGVSRRRSERPINLTPVQVEKYFERQREEQIAIMKYEQKRLKESGDFRGILMQGSIENAAMMRRITAPPARPLIPPPRVPTSQYQTSLREHSGHLAIVQEDQEDTRLRRGGRRSKKEKKKVR